VGSVPKNFHQKYFTKSFDQKASVTHIHCCSLASHDDSPVGFLHVTFHHSENTCRIFWLHRWLTFSFVL